MVIAYIYQDPHHDVGIIFVPTRRHRNSPARCTATIGCMCHPAYTHLVDYPIASLIFAPVDSKLNPRYKNWSLSHCDINNYWRKANIL